MRNFNDALRRSSIVLLALIMVITCIPFFAAAPVYAADDTYVMEEVVKVDGVDVNAEKKKAETAALAADGVTEADSDAADELIDDADQNPQPVNENTAKGFIMSVDQNAAEEKEPESEPQTTVDVSRMEGVSSSSIKLQETPDGPKDCKITIQSYTDGTAYVTAYVNDEGWAFDYMAMDGTTMSGDDIYGSRTINGYIDKKEYSVGYHTFELMFIHNGESTNLCLPIYYLETGIYSKPATFKTDNFTTTTKSIKYYNSGNYYSYDNDCQVYVDLKKKGGSWKKGQIKVSPYYTKGKGGLKANATYSARGYYAKNAYYDYDGKTYTFEGPSKTVKTLKTGYKKPKVKKIDISKVKVRVRKYRYWTGKIRQRWLVNARTGQRIRLIKQWKLYRTVRSYTTRYKVTVSFKKKQGVAGIQLHTSHGYTVWLRGDRKKYSKTFTVPGKKRGKKLRVSVKSKRSNKYEGWSGTYKKKVSIR